MAAVIEFYVPKDFRRNVTSTANERGKLIAFRSLRHSRTYQRAGVDLSVQQLESSDLSFSEAEAVLPQNWVEFATEILAYAESAFEVGLGPSEVTCNDPPKSSRRHCSNARRVQDTARAEKVSAGTV